MSRATAPELLHRRGLFTFAEAGLGVLDAFFEETLALHQTADPMVELMPELVCLTAAEYALEPLIATGRNVRPGADPIPVDADRVTLALVKADTNLLRCWSPVGRPPPERRKPSFTIADVTAFSGDAAKLAAIGALELMQGDDVMAGTHAAVVALEEAHRNAGSALATAIAESGVLSLQGLLWAVKLALPRTDVEDAIDRALRTFGVALPV
jgi:hypothetical protein